ncbi:MAG: class I SAM-dependent methyltransferase [Magnetococcus sp. DMHC-6]
MILNTLQGLTPSQEKLLSRFPKSRPLLPDPYTKIYHQHILDSRNGQGLIAGLVVKMEQWVHRQIQAQGYGYPTLEIGAGTLNHLAYEPISNSYDVVEPYIALYKGQIEQNRIRNFYNSITDIPCQHQYQRILSVFVLEHVEDLPQLLAWSACLLKPTGLFIVGIPSEGGGLWSLGWRFGTGLAFRWRTGLSYKPMMRFEHINTAGEIMALSHLFFHHVQTKFFPLPSFHLSFYTFMVFTSPRYDVAEEYLQRYK